MGFCFAQRFHPAMRFVGPVRKELGVPTVFNFLGPLINPARTRHQLVGVSDPAMAPIMAGVFGATGSRHAMIVHADDGLDELSVTSPSSVLEVRGDGVGRVRGARLAGRPGRAGLRPGDDGRTCGAATPPSTPASSARCSRASGAPGATSGCSTPRRRSWWRAGSTTSASGLELAAESIDSGRAARRARRAGRYVARRAAPADGLTRQARRGACAAGSRAGESGRAQRDDAAAEAAAGHAGPEDARLGEEVLDQLVDGGHRDPVVAGQAAVALGHDRAEAAQVAPGEQPLGLVAPGRTR